MKKIAVFMIFGQSNATGHGVPMTEGDIIKEPLKNVFGLNREPNQSFDTEKLKFTGYTSYGMNLAENQDNTYSVPNCLAKNWQSDIDNGVELPDLYIIHISIGSQGVYGMWSPERPKKLIPGKLGDCDISMYPFAVHVLSLFKKYMEENELEPDFVGMHWRGGEQEFWQAIPNLKDNDRLKNTYKTIFSGLRKALGYEFPIVIHKMNFEAVLKGIEDGKHLPSMHFINEVFSDLCNEVPNVTMFDSTRAPHYNPEDPYTLFRWDLIHYSPQTNDWVSRDILEEYKKR